MIGLWNVSAYGWLFWALRITTETVNFPYIASSAGNLAAALGDRLEARTVTHQGLFGTEWWLWDPCRACRRQLSVPPSGFAIIAPDSVGTYQDSDGGDGRQRPFPPFRNS
jgi:hypothetical protein